MNVTLPGKAKKTERMFLIADPVLKVNVDDDNDVRMTEGQWATSAVEEFGRALSKYIGYGSGSSPSHGGADAQGDE